MLSVKSVLVGLALVAYVTATTQPSPIPCPASAVCPSTSLYLNLGTLQEGNAALVASSYSGVDASCTYTFSASNGDDVTYTCNYVNGVLTSDNVPSGAFGCDSALTPCSGSYYGRRKRSDHAEQNKKMKAKRAASPKATLTPELKARNLIRNLKPHSDHVHQKKKKL